MRLITNQYEKALCERLAEGLTGGKVMHFSDKWIRQQDWKVVPVEDTAHFAPEEIVQLIKAFCKSEYSECFAIATEPVSRGSEFYRVPLTKRGFQSFNSKCGVLRYLLTVEDRSWAISCGEWFNLFAARPALLEQMLGQSIDTAYADFANYARLLITDKDDSAFAVAEHYAALNSAKSDV